VATTARYRTNARAIYSLKYHLVWTPKYRRPVLVDGVADRLTVLLREKAAEIGATVHGLKVLPDQVHLFVASDPTRAPANIAAQFKGSTSRVLRAEFPHLRSRLPTLWSRSYYIGSVGHVSAATVQRYVESQWARM